MASKRVEGQFIRREGERLERGGKAYRDRGLIVMAKHSKSKALKDRMYQKWDEQTTTKRGPFKKYR